jgi:hypothetical protein
MCAAAAQRARRLRAVRPAFRAGGPPVSFARSGDAGDGISPPNIGRTLPRTTRGARRAPARTAATSGWRQGDCTPARVLRAAMALQRIFVCEKDALPRSPATRNSANIAGSAGSQVAPRPAAKPAQARRGIR